MRNKNFILGIGFILIITLIAIVSVFLYTPKDQVMVDNGDPFGDTTALRRGTTTTDAGVFGDVTELLGTSGGATAQPAPQLRLLSEVPVSGAGVYSSVVGSSSVEYVRYVEKTTGNIRETPLATVVASSLLSQKTLLRVAHAFWSPNGRSLAILRFNETSDVIFGYLGLLTASTSQAMLEGRPLPNDIISTAFSPNSSAVAYLLAKGDGTTLFVEQTQTGTRKELWSSPLKNLTIRWDSTNIMVYTNPTSHTVGVVWLIDPVSGKATKILGGENALAAKGRADGSKILYSLFEQAGVPSLRVRDLTTSNVTYMPMATVVEKCAWGPVGTSYVYCAIPRAPLGKGFVDGMYQGIVATDDVLWRFNVDTGEASQLIDLFDTLKVRLDVEYPMVSNDGQYLIFKTRKNDYLWALQLPAVTTEIPTQ